MSLIKLLRRGKVAKKKGYVFMEHPQTKQQGIKCLTCNLTSYNTNDIRYRYCGYCHVFHDDF